MNASGYKTSEGPEWILIIKIDLSLDVCLHFCFHCVQCKLFDHVLFLISYFVISGS